jgi:hypothetical protein
MPFDAVAIALLLHHVGQTHVFGIGILYRITVGILPTGHGQADVFPIRVVDGVTGSFVGPNKARDTQTQKSNGDFHEIPPLGLTLFISFWLTMCLGNAPLLLKSI